VSHVVVGISHNTAPIQLREQVAFLLDDLSDALQCLSKTTRIREAYILSTCNRTEIYSQIGSPDKLLSWLAQYRDIAYSQLATHAYKYQGTQVFNHMMRVACGLDSMILGEPQVLGQMKEAYLIARKAGTIGQQLQYLIDKVFAFTKTIRSQTPLHAKSISIACTMVGLLKAQLPDFSSKRILLIGTGRTSQLVATHLRQQGATHWLTVSRDAPWVDLPRQWSGELVVSMAMLPMLLPTVDVIISACTVNQPLLTKAMLASVKQAVWIFDLGVPRNVDEQVNDLPTINLYNIDSLQKVVDDGWLIRKKAAEVADQQIIQATLSYQKWQREVANTNMLQALRKTLQIHQQQELAWASRHLAAGESADAVLEQFARRLMNKWLHVPTERLRRAIQEQQDTLLNSACELFDLDR